MKVSGTTILKAPRNEVWAALNDPAVLVRTIPGCQRLEATGPDAYKMTVAAGVGSIKGVYDGEVRLTDQEQPGSFRMHAQGSGAPGTIGAEVAVTLVEHPEGGTHLTYDADATVGGMIGGVGQRMLTGVSKKMAAEFFGNVEAVLLGTAPAEEAAVAAAPVEAGVAGAAAAPVFTAPGAAPSAGRGAAGEPGFALGVAVGAVVALAGAVVGGWLAGRRHG
jgi:carbon monoxide dehydrogenase subunit G